MFFYLKTGRKYKDASSEITLLIRYSFVSCSHILLTTFMLYKFDNCLEFCTFIISSDIVMINSFKINLRVFAILCFFLLKPCHCPAQDTTSAPLIIGVRSHWGFIIPHSKKIEKLSHTNPWGIEMDINWHLTKEKTWQYFFCYPRTGFSLLYINFSNPEVIGSTIALYPFIEPFTSAQKPFSLSIRFGMGPAYMTKIYDPEKNPENLFNSSHLSFIVVLNLGFNYRISPNMNLRISGSYNHTSNGGIKQPNLGINFPTINAGLDWSLSPAYFPDREKDPELVPNPEKFRFEIYLFGTGKIDSKGSKSYLISGLGFNFSERVGRINALTCGIEWINDGEIKNLAEEEQITNRYGKIIDHHRLGILFGHELLLGRFIFSQQLGFYLYSPYEPLDAVYQRYGISYKISDRIFTGINIKAHRHVADFLDIRTGITF